MHVSHKRWNPDLITEQGKGGMEDWWPGKCCPRHDFHSWWDCKGVASGLPQYNPGTYHVNRSKRAKRDTIPQSAGYTYVPKKPWDGLDKRRWPSTFATLMLLYYSPDWWTSTKYVETEEEKAELRKTYGYYNYTD